MTQADCSPFNMLYGNVADVNDPLSSSGSAYPLYRELAQSANMIGAINPSFNRLHGHLNTLINFHPQFGRWKERRHKSMITLRHHSRIAQKQSTQFTGKYDFYFQQRALFDPAAWIQDIPYSIYTDCTHWNTLREWAPWSPFSQRELEQWLQREKQIYDRAALLFPWSQFAADSMINDYGQPPEKIIVAGSGINFTEPPPPHGEYDGKTVLFIGYDFDRKGGPDLIQAFRKIPEARLIIAGPTELKIGLPKNVELIGPVRDRKTITALYQKASLFVMPSHYEPWGSVYLEAMGHGVPCIANDKAAAPEIITHGIDGELVPPGDIDALAESMIRLLQSPKTLKAFGDAAREKVLTHFTWKTVAQRMTEHIQRYLSEKA